MSELAKITYRVDANIIPKFQASAKLLLYEDSHTLIFLPSKVFKKVLRDLIVSSDESASTKQKLTHLGHV